VRATLSVVDAKNSLEKKLLARYKRLLSATSVDVGFFPQHIHPEAHVPVATVAAWQEWGTNGKHPSPPRPFFRYSVDTYSAEWAELIRVSLKATNFDAKAALTAVGQLVTMRIKAVITAWDAPPNAVNPKTGVPWKGFNDPLIETKYMLRHVTYKVNTK
jgi:hypothetical protein